MLEGGPEKVLSVCTQTLTDETVLDEGFEGRHQVVPFLLAIDIPREPKQPIVKES